MSVLIKFIIIKKNSGKYLVLDEKKNKYIPILKGDSKILNGDCIIDLYINANNPIFVNVEDYVVETPDGTFSKKQYEEFLKM